MSKKDKCKLDYKHEYKNDCNNNDKHDDYKQLYEQMHQMMGHMYCGLCQSLHHSMFAMLQQMYCMPYHHPIMPMPDMCTMPCPPAQPAETVPDLEFHVSMPEMPPTICLPGLEPVEKKKMG